MSEQWRELERAAENMKKLSRNPNLSHSQRSQLERDASKIADEARKQQQAYVNWLWGH